MCGILGGFNTCIQRNRYESALNLLSHRGPDGSGFWESDDHRCTLCHRRLAIMDLSEAGNQPMMSPDGNNCIVFNGEIYNFIEIREELKRKGYIFKSNCDTEVALIAYSEWGEKCFDMFNGMWAMAVYNVRERFLLLSRDRFGVKPLYYAKTCDGGFVFGSEMKAIIPLLKNVSVNKENVTNSMKIIYGGYESETPINEINKVLPGHYIRIENNGIIHDHRWWDTLKTVSAVPDDYGEQCEIFRELFLDACRLRMRSDVIIGTALSGGLDSSATICAMAHIAKKYPSLYKNENFQNAFVASFPATSLDETRYARIVTSHLGIEETVIDIDPLKGLNQLPDLLYGFENVYFTSPVPMIQTYEAMREKGVYVTMDGHGADELFGGYPFDIEYALLDAKPFDRNMKDIFKAYNSMYPNDGSNLSQRNRWNYKHYLYFNMSYYLKRIKSQSCLDDTLFENQIEFKRLSHFDRKLYISTHFAILPTLLRNYDLYSMLNGVEIRMPFLDYRIVQFAFSIDWKSKIRDGFTKSIIRDSLNEIIPDAITNRTTKIGFNTPIVEWVKGPWREWILDEIHSQAFVSSDFLDAKSLSLHVQNVINNHSVSYHEVESIWTKMAPYLWEKYFYKKAINSR